jgi:spore coat polysaccharide biosynthesis protein SpsF (cytidylyltransferase family)
MSAAALVQARMGSTRLPGKVLADVAGQPLLARILARLSGVDGLDEVMVVTSDAPRDLEVVELARSLGYRAFAGSELDVLDRYHRAAEGLDADVLVRVTADCPLVDPSVIERLLSLHAAGGADYTAVATGALPPSRGLLRFPDGLDAEAFGRSALAVAWEEASDPYEREHATPFLYRRPDRFRLAMLEAETDMGSERWTVDHPDDLEFVRAVYGRLGDAPFGYRDVLALLEREPSLRALNAHHVLHP